MSPGGDPDNIGTPDGRSGTPALAFLGFAGGPGHPGTAAPASCVPLPATIPSRSGTSGATSQPAATWPRCFIRTRFHPPDRPNPVRLLAYFCPPAGNYASAPPARLRGRIHMDGPSDTKNYQTCRRAGAACRAGPLASASMPAFPGRPELTRAGSATRTRAQCPRHSVWPS